MATTNLLALPPEPEIVSADNTSWPTALALPPPQGQDFTCLDRASTDILVRRPSYNRINIVGRSGSAAPHNVLQFSPHIRHRRASPILLFLYSQSHLILLSRTDPRRFPFTVRPLCVILAAMAVDAARRRPDPLATGAMYLILAGVPGVLLSAFLTVVKFRSLFRCDFALLAACSSDCSAVLSSNGSVLFGIPVSIYSTAYYLVLLGLATAVLTRPERTLPIARPLLLILAWAGLVASLVLAGYSALIVGGYCQYCMVIYGLNVTVFLATSLMHPEGPVQGLRALARRRVWQSTTTLIAGLSFLALVSVQMMWYRLSAVELHIERQCVVDRGQLPGTVLHTATPAKPWVQVALFVDFSCQFCRDEFRVWKDYVAQHQDTLSLAVFHYAREDRCIPDDFRSLSSSAQQNHSCRAARAVECAELLQPGSGLSMIDALFALQLEGSPYFTAARVGEAAKRAGLADVPTDMESPATFKHPFYTCLDDDDSVEAHRIRSHAEFGRSQQLTETPATYLIFFDKNGHPRPSMVKIRGAKRYGDVEETLRQAEQRVIEATALEG